MRRSHWTPALGLVAILASLGCSRSEQKAQPSPTVLGTQRAALVTETSLDVVGDTFLKQGSPNQNLGGDTVLSLQSSGKHRSLLFVDASQVAAAVGAGTLVSARLELTIFSSANNWGSGRPIALHRLKLASSEYEATWACARDGNVNNQQPDCSGPAAWDMGSTDPNVQPWQSPATATTVITSGQTGVVSFDVMPDVAALLGGTWSGPGWLLKKVDEGENGAIEFASRERAPAPRLVLEIDGGPGAGGPPDPPIGSAFLTANGDTHVRQGQPNQNFGTDSLLRIQSSGRNRALLAFDAQAIASALGGELVSARLDLPVATTYSNWGPDRALGAHRLLQGWSELGATWNCASDSNPGNGSADCSGDAAWTLSGSGEPPFLAAPTDTELVQNEQTGELHFDVTRDVACALAGHATSHGWLIKKALESQNGKIELSSRESATPPRLRVEWTDGDGVEVTAAQCGNSDPGGPGCTPTAPVDTTCNGQDEDCDGVVDDDYAVTEVTCGTGACTGAGTTSCVAGSVTTDCSFAQPDDSNPCTADSCDAAGTPVFAPLAEGTPCGDGNACNGNETCNGSGTCADGADPSLDDGDPCSADTCDPLLGVQHGPAPDGTGCDDASACTQLDTCLGGVCTGQNPVVCTALDQCHEAGNCDGATGLCSNPARPDGVPCQDGDACTLEDACEAGACVPGGATPTDDGNPCTLDGCEPSQGVTHAPAPAGNSCADADACNGQEACDGNGACANGTPPVMDDGNLCTADSCDPATGVRHQLIEGCDGGPIVAGGRFETRVSVLGKVLNASGSAVTNFTVAVHDAPASGEPRTDVQVSTSADGSFRARLTGFPESFAEFTPSAHLVVRIESDSFVPLMRDVYVRPGDAVDLGRVYLLERDPEVTVIGPAGGVASDSLGRIQITFPAGAVAAPTPVQITPIPERRLFPHPLPDATMTTYGMVLEPSQEFAAPVIVRVQNTLDVPTSLQIPVGVVDEENGGWDHEAFAVWDGSAFRFELKHFSTVDCNPSRAGQLYMFESKGSDSSKAKDGNCAGSSVSYGSGALRQSFSLPGYVRHGRDYGVTLHYDSSLTGAHRLGKPPASTNAEAAGTPPAEAPEPVPAPPGGFFAPISLPIRAPTYSFACLSGGGGGSGGCATGSACFGFLALDLGFRQYGSIAGTEFETEVQLSGGQTSLSTSYFVSLPVNEDGSVPRPDYFPFERHTTISAPLIGGAGGGGGNCTGGGSVFAAQASAQNPVLTNLEPGPTATVQGYELLYHRRSSPFGTGWGVGEVHEAFKAPNDAQIELEHGDGHEESFYPRIEPDAVVDINGSALGRDAESGEVFVYSNGITQVNSDWSTTPVTSSLGLSGVRAIAVGHVDGERHFFVANSTGLHEVGPAGTAAQLASWTLQSSVFNRPRVAADDKAVYFTNGVSNVIHRILFDDPSRTISAIGLGSGGNIALDPEVPAGEVSFDTPRGLAMGPDGALYVTCFQRHMVYRLLPDEDGVIGPDSEVERVLGNGMGSFSQTRGGLEVALKFGMNQPLDLAFSEDGYLFVMNSQGIVRYDPVSQMARWFVNERDQGLTFETDADPSFVALDRDRVLINNSDLITLTSVGMTSEFEPRRRMLETPTGLQLVDTAADVIETYEWAEGDRVKARLVSRVARTGEPLLTVGYVAGADRVAWLEDPSGGRFSFAYDSSGRLDSIEDAAGRTSFVDIDGSNNLREIVSPTGEARRFDYYGHLMVAALDSRGEQTSYDYHDDGTVSRVTRPGGSSREFSPAFGGTSPGTQVVHQGSYVDEYGVSHNVQVDEAGRVVRDQFVADGVPYDVRQVYAGTLAGSFREDRLNDILRVSHTTVNGVQVSTTTTWDALGRPTRVSNPASGTGINGSATRYSVSYNADGRVFQVSPAEGNLAHRYTYDANGRVARIQDFVASTGGLRPRYTDFAWRSDGQIDVLTDHATPTSHSYDAATGNLVALSDVTQSLIFAHDAAGNVTLESDGASVVTKTYDDSNRLSSVVDALGHATQFGYSQEGCDCARDDLVTSIITPDLDAGSAWQMEYDADGKLVRLIDPAGFSEQFVRTPQGDVAAHIDPLLRSTAFTHDQFGRISTRQDAGGRVGVYTYPVPGSGIWNGPALYAGSAGSEPAPTSLTATLASGQYQVGLNALPTGEGPAQIEVYRDATFALSYGNQVDSLLRLEKRRDRSDLLVSSTAPFGGQPSSSGAFMDGVYTYAIDSTLPLIDSYSSMYASENRFETGSISHNGFLDVVDMSGWGGTGQFSVVEGQHLLTRDGAGRVTALTQRFSTRPPSGGATVIYVPPAWTYSYDANGYPSRIDNGSGIQDLTYDARGLVETNTLSYQAAGAPSTQIEGTFAHQYDELGRSSQLTFPDGHVRVQQFDSRGRLTSRCYEYGAGGTRCYTAEYDAAGNPTVLGDPEGTSFVSYDALDRVVEVRREIPGEPDEVETYDYNALGALAVHAGTAVDHERPRLDGAGTAPAGIPASLEGLPVSLDLGGRVSSLLGAGLVYSKQTRLRDISETGAFHRQGYDALQRRIGYQKAGQPAEAYQFEGDNIVSILTATGLGGVQKRILYDGIDHPLWMYDNVEDITVYFELDIIGNVRRLRGGRAIPAGQAAPPSDLGGYRYTAFGSLYPEDATTPYPEYDGVPFEQPLRWQARPFIPAAGGLYDFRARTWSPELGAFLELDGFEYLTPTGTLWSWPGQNPFRWADPTGREGCDRNGQGARSQLLEALLWLDDNGVLQAAGDFSAGVSSALTFGLSDALIEATELDQYGDKDSTARLVGEVAGTALGIYTGAEFAAAGREITLGKNLRIAPFGNRTGHPTGRYPHYHRRGPADPKTGRPRPGQGMKRHRPWDKKAEDNKWTDRF